MRITEKLNQAYSSPNPPPATFSFEFFVPKTAQGIQNLYDRMDRMYDLNPIFIDITWGAGGKRASLTNEMVYTAQSTLGLETCMHLTCTNMKVELIDEALSRAKASGCQNILALRGDPPLDGSESTGDFQYAKDLITYIRKNYGDYFNIGVAAYPEGHPEEPNDDKTLEFLKIKCDAGADFIVTQMFYDADQFINWCSRIRKIGIDLPIIPGIMPISTYAAFIRRAKWSEISIPQHFLDALDPIKDDDFLVREMGTTLLVEMCQKLLDSGYIKHLHFYTMNLERSTIMVLEKLNLIETVKAHDTIGGTVLPWRKSLNPSRQKETIRPIFWQNRKHSYISRTSTWDEFPNGRWGDSSSPAFGDIDLNATELLRQSPKKAFELWGHPQCLKEFADLTINYLTGKLKSIPWSDGPIDADTSVMTDDLISLNKKGFITINSQPPLNATKSNDKVYGWGPKNGYVFQKQYLEFFCHKDTLNQLLNNIDSFNSTDNNARILTYYMVDKSGDLVTNTKEGDINAVTWGVFPGEEIVQPTIVERNSFLAWKDEAFSLIEEWVRIFESDMAKDFIKGKETEVQNFIKFMKSFGDDFVLCNVVNNNFTDDSKVLFGMFNGLEN
ncbi:methylenetetrahydrofolate reductase 2 [[Candida] jaroonii]|uniref:Methylenetetrahydrofolate reductase 2 n=1 Tax=[Candida] jaroonii TaxID=467808 RepID=A0ACA9YDV9_9ASCO|nr:methylenetetrahydrofolate reductase 2 [[Candida] jaroonii]